MTGIGRKEPWREMERDNGNRMVDIEESMWEMQVKYLTDEWLMYVVRIQVY